MRKKVLALVMGALAISTIGAFAQTETTTCAPQQKECCKNKEGKECKRDKDGKRGEKKMRLNAFEGITLTAEQQQQIDALRKDQRAKREAEKQATKEAKQKSFKEFDEAVSKILTPEQYQQYQTNRESMKIKKEAKRHGRIDKMKKKFHKMKRPVKIEANV